MAKNLSYNPHVVMMAGSAAFRDGFDIVIEGDAVRVADDGVLGRIELITSPEVLGDVAAVDDDTMDA